MAYQAEYPPQGNCESVVEVLIVANNVHEEDAGSFTVEREHAGSRHHTLGGVGSFMAGMERV